MAKLVTSGLSHNGGLSCIIMPFPLWYNSRVYEAYGQNILTVCSVAIKIINYVAANNNVTSVKNRETVLPIKHIYEYKLK